jgi:hypothetical protein
MAAYDPRLALATALASVNAGKVGTKAKYLIIADERPLATLSRRTVIISLQGFVPIAAAPGAGLTIRYTVRVISPVTDLPGAEADAWDAATDIALAIDAIDGANYTEAQKVLHGENRYLAFDLTVEADAEKKETN